MTWGIISLIDSNDVYSWGQGVNGRLGHGDENDQRIPKVIEALLGKDIRGIDCGPSHSAAWNGVHSTLLLVVRVCASKSPDHS